MPSTRPRMTLDETGQCNACSFHATRADTDWADRKEQFLELVKSKKRHPYYDCIVPFSGGKDSAYIAHRLKFELGLNPLLVCYGQMLWTPAGIHNFNAVCNAGFDIQYERVNQDVSRRLAKRFFIERGHPKAHYDAGINAAPVIAARDRGIPLIIYAEFGEASYGGHVLSEESMRRRDLEEVLEHCIGDNPLNWATDGISESDLAPYLYPEDAGDTEAVYYSYYFPFDVYENAMYCREKMAFKWIEPRTDGSFEGWDSIDDAIDGTDFYAMFLKFGFGRATRMASRLINYGHMTVEEAKPLIEKYDGEFPEMYLPEVLGYLDMTRQEYIDTLEMHTEHDL
jgi:N-acetyl sugar amidotransferase